MGRRLLRLAPPGVWLAATSTVAVLTWGMVDPLGLRQRLDWLVADQFLRARRLPPLHPDLVQISIDDRAVTQLGSFPVRRYKLARVLRQLNKLGARSVLIDILFAEPGFEDPSRDEARRHLVPLQNLLNDELPELSARFLDDNLLADSLSLFDRLVIPFYLEPPDASPLVGNALIKRVADALTNEPRLTAEQLAMRLDSPRQLVSRVFDQALAIALDRLASRSLDQRPDASGEEAFLQAVPGVAIDSYLGVGFLNALDRVRTRRLLAKRAGIGVPTGEAGVAFRGFTAESLQTPRLPFVAAARSLGFMDAEIDADGTLRRLPLVARSSEQFYVHQALAILGLHVDCQFDAATLGTGQLKSHEATLRIPVDSHGCLTINWPMNSRHTWDTVIPQISMADLYKLDGYESDLKLAEHDARKCIAAMDGHAADGGVGLAFLFQQLTDAYAAGDWDQALAARRDFDAGRAELFELPDVKKAIERAENALTSPAALDAEPLDQWAQAYVRVKEQIEPLEREYREAFEALQAQLSGKLCLIGDTTTGSTDLKRTPVGGAVPGITVIAAAANTMLTGRYLSVAGFAASACVMLALSSFVSFVSLRYNALPAGLTALGSVIATMLGSFLLVDTAAIMISPVTPVLAVVATYTAVTTYRWWDEFQQKKLVRTIFEAQTNPTIVEQLIQAGAAGVEEVLTPKNRQVTVFFAQIVDYSEMADKIEPERMASVLSRVFGTMAKLVRDHDGTLDRYEGHAMMAFFGAPVYQADHAERACRTALECRAAVRQLKSEPSFANLPALRVHFGIHTGELLVGNITLTSRIDYTVAGDNLSVAYRVADLNETYGCEIMITQATVEHYNGVMDTRELDMVRIKGRRDPIRAYELIAPKGQAPPEKIRLISNFLTGLTAFRNRDYAAALSMFRACREESPTDRATGVYIDRCEKGMAATVPDHDLPSTGQDTWRAASS